VCGRTARTVREGGTGEVETQTRWITRTRRETAGIEPIRRTGHTEPVPYFTRAVDEVPNYIHGMIVPKVKYRLGVLLVAGFLPIACAACDSGGSATVQPRYGTVIGHVDHLITVAKVNDPPSP